MFSARVVSLETQGKRKRVAHNLQMPLNCMYGFLGDVAGTLQMPMGWSYSSCLAVFAARYGGTICADDRLRDNLYVAVTGPANDGKSMCEKRAIKTLNPNRVGIETTCPGSDKGVYKLFAAEVVEGETELTSKLLALDELKTLMQKTSIKGSALPQLLCTLFYEDEAGAADRSGHHRVNVRLTILGALKADDPSDFRASFGSDALGGLYDRFIFVPGPRQPWPLDHAWRPKVFLRDAVPVNVSGANFKRLAEWTDLVGDDGGATRSRRRVGEIGLRVAMISASANGESVISDDCIAAGLRFADWQLQVRTGGFEAGVADDLDGAITTDIIEEFRRLQSGDPNASYRFRDVLHARNWAKKYGCPRVTRAREAMVSAELLIAEESEGHENENGTRIPAKRTGLYRLCDACFPKAEAPDAE